MNKRHIVSLCCVALAVLVGLAADPVVDERAQAFDKLLAKAQREAANLTADEAIQLLKLGKELRRPQAVAMASKTYLSTRQNVPPELMKLAAENARMSGDFRTAVARYKQYLKTAPAGAETSDVAADMYSVMIKYMGAGSDAFNFMDESGEKLRDSMAARKYDQWFMDTARNQRSYAALAKRLVLIMAAQPPLPREQERRLCWGHIDWLMSECTAGRPEQIAALPWLKQIVPLIRESAWHTARYNFFVAHLASKASAAGKDQATLDKEYEAVGAAARAYVDAGPALGTVQDIVRVFAGGFENRNARWDGNDWNRGMPAKREFLKYAFSKLPDTERKALAAWNWNNWANMFGGDTWAAIGTAMPDFMKTSPLTATLQFAPVQNNPEAYRKMTPFLQGVQSQNAAVINSMAVSADDLWACVLNLVQKESWYLNPSDIHALVYRQMCPAFVSYAREDARKLQPRYIESVQQRFGTDVVFKSPIAIFHPDSVREHVLMVWRNNGQDPNDKSKVAAQLHALDWVPYTEEQRRSVFTPAYDEFKRWADEVRKSFENADKVRADNAKALEDAKKARADTTKFQDETAKALETAKKGKADALAAVETTKQTVAGSTKALMDTDAAVKAAKAANDAAKTADAEKKSAELVKGLADLGAKQKQLEAAVQDMGRQVANLQKAAQDLKGKADQQDLAVQDLTKKIETAGNPANSVEARTALLVDIEAAFKQVMDPKIVDPNKGPDPLCQNFAKLALALQAKDQNAYLAAAKALYPMVKDYATKKTPFGQSIFTAVVQNRAEFDVIDWQCEVLADQLAPFDPKVGSQSLRTAIGLMMTGRKDWNWWSIPAGEKDRALKLNNVLAKGLLAMIDKNQFSPDVFEWFRSSRRGNGWQDNAVNANVLAKMITKNSLQFSPEWRPWGATAADNYMYLVRNDFQSIAKDYPPENYFDDMYVAEVSKTRVVDQTFWSYSQDQQRKGANLAATIFQDYAKLPFWGDGKAPAGDFWGLSERTLGGDGAIRDAMLKKIESYYGQSRWDGWAMGAVSIRFMDIATPDRRKMFFDAISAFCDKAAQVPWLEGAPYLPQLANLQRGTDLSPSELNVLVKMLTVCQGSGNGMQRVATLVHEGLMAQKRSAELFMLAPTLWKIARDSNDQNLQRQLAQYTGSLMDAGETDLGATYSTVGIDVLGATIQEDVKNTLLAVRSKAMGAGAVIPVDRGDRRYPIFSAQADYLSGKLDNAWETYLSHRDLLLSEFKELDPAFSTWVLEKHTQVGNYDEAEALAQKLIQWMESAPQGFDPEARAHLMVSYADIAFTRQEYPRARAQYERIAVAKEFDGTLSKKMAEMKIAEVDRLTKNYDRAVEQLEKLARRKDTYLQAEANYQLALIKYDQEDFSEARNYLDQVFAVDMNHSSARILEGKLYLKVKKYLEATGLRLGQQAGQETILPGKPLKVQLQDRNLAIVGKASEIEVRVWADSGDEESFRLLPFGDSKTKFEGQINTAMGKLVKGDHVLQVLGSDTVHYDFSDKFKKANKIVDAVAASIAVVSDPELYVSSGKILTKEQQEQKALEQMIRERSRTANTPLMIALSTVRAENEIKPGNKINVRIVDLDENTSTNRDRIKLKVSTTSGDMIEGFTVRESEPYSGVFEGEIPTVSAPATAFASDSEEGKDANQAISAGNYAGWVGLADNIRPKTFSIDLNTSVALGNMTVLADVPGRRLKSVIVQTSMNGKEFVNAGAWPVQLPAWDGALRLEIVRYAGSNGAPATIEDFRNYLDVGCVARGAPKLQVPAATSISWDQNVGGFGDRMGLAWDGAGSWYIAHLSGAFFVPKRQVRTFRLDPKGRLENIRYFLTLDGSTNGSTMAENAKPKDEQKPYEISGSLRKGVHRLDVYVCAQRKANPAFEIMNDIPKAPYMAVCAPDMFDPVKHPEIAAMKFQPAEIKPTEGNNGLTVAFPANLSTRMLRLWLLDFETDAPAIKKITLTDASGQPVLPTKQDLMSLRKNQTLEIIPGDKISIVYEDARFVTKEKQINEATMMATFHNATLSACFVESTLDNSGNRTATYIPMRRFNAGDTINVFIADPDEDQTEARDKIKFTASTSVSKAITIEAIETKVHSGIFLGKVFPVKGAPQRPSELTLSEGDDMILSYLDKENTDPGIPWKRNYLVEQTSDRPPELRVYDVVSRALTTAELKGVPDPGEARQYEEYVPVVRTITESRPAEANRETPATGLLGVGMVIELTYPTIVLSPLSKAAVYVQTESGREKYGRAPEGAFDLNVPGTIRLERTPGDAAGLRPPPGYAEVLVRGNPYAANALDDGRFCFAVPLKLGKVPDKSLVPDEAEMAKPVTGEVEEPVVSVRGGDKVYVGFEYKDAKGATNWIVQTMVPTSDVFFDVMECRYQKPLSSIHVGESLYLRVIDSSMDTTDNKDSVAIRMKTSTTNQQVALTETFAHSGVFKGVCQLAYAGDKAKMADVGILGVAYGDTVTARYTAIGTNKAPETRTLLVYKGSDGQILPFTKRFKDPEIAVQTQFTIAESYLEMAKKHRELAQESLARREIAQGKKLLDEAIRDYPNTEARAQADYLLAELALEFANDAVNEDAKKNHYAEAVSRFSDIVATYPDSPQAPKAQYKKALVYEKMGEIDQACEEYVKLSYRYPDNELVAETIARLGQYFLSKGKALVEKANAASDLVEKEKLKIQARDMNRTAAQVFGRLALRFPEHRLAGKTLVLSAQCYMRAEDFDKAIDVFKKIISDKKAESELIAQSMYWCGDCHMKKKDYTNAYRMFKKVTWDYPESTWAKYARGRLSEDALAKVEADDTSSGQ